MNFGELRFWLLLFCGLSVILPASAICARVSPRFAPTFDKIGLASLGLLLLAAVNWLTWLIFVLVLLISYFGMRISLRLERPKTGLAVILPLLFIPLLYYKYADFIARGVLASDYNGFRDLVIPVGISFYTFQKAAALVDTLVFKKPLPKFLDYLNFAAFFPQIVAGPIERRDNLLPQMEQFRLRITGKNLDEGVPWLALGFFFKRGLADNLAQIFDASSTTNPYSIWLANIVFGLRIYFDFAGYSFIALGIARCLGVGLTLNFHNPYCARNPVDFWRRWHITLSQWFRDYVYVPLGGGRTRFWAVTVLIVFLVSGLWHGAGWNFLIWGFLHALFLIFTRLIGKRNVPFALPWMSTMVGVFFAWMFFYETRNEVVWQKTATLFAPSAYKLANLRAALAAIGATDGILVVLFLGLAMATLGLEFRGVRNEAEPYSHFRRTAAAALLIILACWLGPGAQNEFIYFAF